MNITEVFMSSDNKSFNDENKAVAYQVDLLGELLDGFLPNDDRGNVTAIDRYNLLMKQLKDKNLYTKILNIAAVIEYMQDNDITVKDTNNEANRIR
jgi:hypothetical protein